MSPENRQFLKPNHSLLTKKAEKVLTSAIKSHKTQKIITQLLSIAYGQQKDRQKSIMVGLAAPQIGILKRIILVDVKADGKGRVGDLRVYINPQITWKSKKQVEWYEGCFSTGKVCGIVSRPISIKIRAYIPGFKASQPLGFRATRYVARIFQHEIDHLNGKRFPDLIKDPNKLHWVLKKEFPLYRNKQAWRNWSKKCSFEKWKKIKYK